MNIKLRLTLMNFLQFFVWGAWLISAGGYMFSLGFTGLQISSIYGTMGVASLFMPALLGIVLAHVILLVQGCLFGLQQLPIIRHCT